MRVSAPCAGAPPCTEVTAYAERLDRAGIDVELVVDTMPQGMDMLAWVPRMRAFRQAAVDALGRALA